MTNYVNFTLTVCQVYEYKSFRLYSKPKVILNKVAKYDKQTNFKCAHFYKLTVR